MREAAKAAEARALTSGTKVDLVLSSFASEHSTAIDFTVSCPLLPTYAKSVVVWASVGSVAVAVGGGAAGGAWAQVRAWEARVAGLE